MRALHRYIIELDDEPGHALVLHTRRAWVRLGDAANAILRVNGQAAAVPDTAGPVSLLVTPAGVHTV